jgi:hypothetical protein
VRHVRMLGISLGAVFAMCALTLGFAAPALAKKTSESEYEKFNQCPFGYTTTESGFEELNGCIYGEAGKESFFQAGKVTVKFVKPIILRGGFWASEESEAANGNEQHFVGARNGEAISKEAEPAPSLTEGVDAELLPPAEKARYEEYLAAGKSTKVKATVELAKPATQIGLHEASLLAEEDSDGFPAFIFPVEIHLTNKFLGPWCYVGSTTEPIEVPFTTGETNPPAPNTPIHGYEGTPEVNSAGTILHLSGTTLVNNEYAAPGVRGCGVEGGADSAINAALGLPSPAGSNTTELIGNLFQAGRKRVEEHLTY